MIWWITNKALNNRVVNIKTLTTTGVFTRTIENRSVWRLMALTAAWKIGSYNHVLLRLCLHCTLIQWDTLIEIWWVYEFVKLQHKFTLKSGYTVLIEPTSKLSFSHAACIPYGAIACMLHTDVKLQPFVLFFTWNKKNTFVTHISFKNHFTLVEQMFIKTNSICLKSQKQNISITVSQI